MSSIEDEEHVYFFFRESAVEHINCGKVSVSNQLPSIQTIEHSLLPEKSEDHQERFHCRSLDFLLTFDVN